MLEGLALTPKRVNKSARRAVRRLAPREAAVTGGMNSSESAPLKRGAFSLAAKQIFFGASVYAFASSSFVGHERANYILNSWGPRPSIRVGYDFAESYTQHCVRPPFGGELMLG